MENLIQSIEFKEKLNFLNNNLKQSLENENKECILIGNLFYDHAHPNFYNSELLDDCKEKRIRFSNAMKNRTSLFEIGLNGGHSAFLALMSNEKLKVYSNDIAEFYPPCQSIHPEIYVEVAANTLKELFGERFSFIKGSCLTQVPKFVKENNNVKFDIVHIDGSKETYGSDFFNILPSLSDNALVIFDDTNMSCVNKLINKLIEESYLYRIDEFPEMDNSIKYRNEVLLYKKK